MQSDVNKYYTPRGVASLIVNCLESEPKSVIDICAGSWNLLGAAAERWPDAHYTGVDVRATEVPPVLAAATARSFVSDGRIFAVKALKSKVQYDLVLANPPFGYENIENDLLEQLGTISIPKSLLARSISTRLEATMLLVNSALVADNGTLAIIVPDSVVSSDRFTDLRRYLLQDFVLVRVLELPDTTFGRKNTIHTYVLFLKRAKGVQAGVPCYRVVKFDDHLSLAQLPTLSVTQVERGEWAPRDQSRVAQITGRYEILRGRVGTEGFSPHNRGRRVVHSTDVLALRTGKAPGSTQRLSTVDERDYPTTQPGDILFVRVGKSAGTAVLWASDEAAVLSDCVFAVRASCAKVRAELERCLVAEERSPVITSLVRGVAARHITVGALRNALGG